MSDALLLRRGQASVDDIVALFAAPLKMARSANVGERRIAVAEASQILHRILGAISGRPRAELGRLMRAHPALAEDARVWVALDLRNKKAIHRLAGAILEDPLGDDALSESEAVAAVEGFQHAAIRVLQIPLSPSERAELMSQSSQSDSTGGYSSVAEFLETAMQAGSLSEAIVAFARVPESDWYQKAAAERARWEAERENERKRRKWVSDYAESLGLTTKEVLSAVLRQKGHEEDLTIEDVDIAFGKLGNLRGLREWVHQYAENLGLTVDEVLTVVPRERIESLTRADIEFAHQKLGNLKALRDKAHEYAKTLGLTVDEVLTIVPRRRIEDLTEADIDSAHRELRARAARQRKAEQERLKREAEADRRFWLFFGIVTAVGTGTAIIIVVMAG
jgi:hypothetical protein